MYPWSKGSLATFLDRNGEKWKSRRKEEIQNLITTTTDIKTRVKGAHLLIMVLQTQNDLLVSLVLPFVSFMLLSPARLLT